MDKLIEFFEKLETPKEYDEINNLWAFCPQVTKCFLQFFDT